MGGLSKYKQVYIQNGINTSILMRMLFRALIHSEINVTKISTDSSTWK